jgi:hypothetical protein
MDPAKNNAPEGEYVPPAADESILREIWDFLRVRKKFWLAPIIIALMLLALLFFVAGQASVVSPFIYAL